MRPPRSWGTGNPHPPPMSFEQAGTIGKGFVIV
jgi:hypothetical protein